ncbi:hypothetical protein [Vibrio phage JSF13]|jgi:hypothetical protein|uniref:Uncharacterized protein ORF9 n=1 Tax=Vibrio phage ICP1 TaxID=979525 RepID=F1D131_9CAUD|nr:hypothetical protein ViPhICP1_gp009 [Vibrio phage ICP1]ADX88054.1 hypothetical protein TUST1-191_00040 [Vibrio phage ICP1_2006_D]ADX88281.1 hypothetical protein TUST1-182_00040 [Vibrio phage ICP1_2006_C]ADX88508.1 hypothetical protein TUST1-159_00040 [Vibrio phage ICP1_2006_B]ADX88734.1 hypothetical protein TUST1-17_00040 [Vibrio phage ICP1_2006_A]ADX88960.1 hypothetical protein TUST1-15_00040 [Vibrio phage ICP1_2005_A]ADX89190.1 hypothetical protein TUST1-2_00040 [Vibrio phage ICP1_2001_A
MQFVPTHTSIDLNQLVMVKGGVVYVQSEDLADVEAIGYSWEYNSEYLIPLQK